MKKHHTLYKLDESGTPVPVDLANPHNALDWGEWRWKHHQKCVVAKNVVCAKDGGPLVEISTVFTGTNAGGDPPLLWETMFRRTGGDEGHYASYASRVDAEVGHLRALTHFQKVVDQDN